MCQFKSGIAIQKSESEVDVRVIPLNDSHTDIREKHHISEDNLGLSRFSTPVELIPTRLDFEDKSCWALVFDAGKPDWWVDCMTDQCIDQLLKAAKSDFEAVMSGEKYEKSLDLGRLTSIPIGFNPTVGGNLYLHRLTSIPDGFNPTVGINLYLHSLTSIPDEFNPTVGGHLDLDSLTSIPDSVRKNVKGKVYLK